MKSSPVVHFEMPAKDKVRVSKFYTDAFGWEMQTLNPEYGGYVMAMTAESDKKGPLAPGAINGGFFDYKDDDLNRAPHLVLSVENLDEAIKKVEEAGGKVEGGKMDIQMLGCMFLLKTPKTM